MKKIFLMLVVLSGMSLTANAQWGSWYYYPSYSSDPCVQSSIMLAHSSNWVNQNWQMINNQPQWLNSNGYYGNNTYYQQPQYAPEHNHSNYSGRTPKTCGLCDGKGTIAQTGTTFGLSGTEWCSECGKTVSVGHYHEKCPSCNGAGKW